mgnify:CR=1 FL=1
MKAVMLEMGIYQLPTNRLPALIGVFGFRNKQANHSVEGVSFKVHFDIDTLDREGFFFDLRDKIAEDMEVLPGDVVIDKDKILTEMRSFRWKQ